MGVVGDWWRGTCRVGDQQKFDRICRRMARGEEHLEHEARALAEKLGIRPEKKR